MMNESVKWYEKAGKESDVVCSTRVRLARNLKSYPFPDRANLRQKKEIEEKVRGALMSAGGLMPGKFEFAELSSLSNEVAVSMVERHLVSPGFISGIEGKALLISDDESISIMINEEDHIRIQVIKEGFCPKETFEAADRIDSLMKLDYAFDDELGYLTQCPTNLGTALRVSVMMHLPALTEYNVISRMASNLSKLGITIRGTYGEGTKVSGAMYQMSNQVTLGLTENEALENLAAIAGQVIAEERQCRGIMIKNIGVQDKIVRSAGLLKSARIMSGYEFMDLISYVRLGISAGILSGITHAEINKLITDVQSATLMTKAGKQLGQAERNILRAQRVREICKKIEE